VVQVHPGPPFKSPVNTRLFSLFPFSGLSLKKPFCQPFVNFTIAGWHYTEGVKTLRVIGETASFVIFMDPTKTSWGMVDGYRTSARPRRWCGDVA